MSKVQIIVDSSAAQRVLIASAATINDPEPIMRAAGSVLLNRIRLGFRHGKAPDGTPWAPLKFRQGQILVDSTHLRKSIKLAVSGDTATVGTNVRYAKTHQFGAVIVPVKAKLLRFRNKLTGAWIFAKKVKVPARPFMPLNPAGQPALPKPWEKAIRRAVERQLAIALKTQGASA